MRVNREIAILGVLATVAACATAPAPQRSQPAVRIVVEQSETAPTAAPDGSSAVAESLYARIDSYLEQFELGLDLLLSGEGELGSQSLEEASAGIRAATRDCLRLPACDTDRVFAAYDYLLDEQRDSLERQILRLGELEMSAPEDSTTEPEASPYSGYLPERTVSLLRGSDLRSLITLNGPVKAALDDWLTWMRPQLMTSYFNYQFLRSRMAPIYEQAELPEALLFGMLATESGGKVHAYSRAGAAGPLQFIRSTGRRYGLVESDGFDLRLDPVAATRANVGYINDQLARLNGNLEKVLAAYNGGEARMGRVHRRHPQAGFFDREVYYQFPRETRQYVPRVLAAAWLFLHPDRYNLEFPTVDAETTRMAVRQDIALGELAVCLGQNGYEEGWFRTLRNLNPRVGPGDRVEAGVELEIPTSLVPVYEERCLEGEVLASARELYEANYPQRPEMIPYLVRSGDSLGRIAARHSCVSLRELAAVNNIRAPKYLIRAGQRLSIPACR